MTIAEYAEKNGVTRQTIYNLLKRNNRSIDDILTTSKGSKRKEITMSGIDILDGMMTVYKASVKVKDAETFTDNKSTKRIDELTKELENVKRQLYEMTKANESLSAQLEKAEEDKERWYQMALRLSEPKKRIENRNGFFARLFGK